jgi:N-methylhydantoinase A/oxoprolinase/acetone carboxylase beta subunit
MKQYTIGIDVGGTNTDAVIIDRNKQIIAACKTITTDPVGTGFKQVIEQVLVKANVDSNQVSGVFVGTTHATNALLQQKELFKVGVIRLTSKSCAIIPSCYGWPQPVIDAVYVGAVSVDGGYECDGRVIKKINKQQIEQAVNVLLQNGMQGCAIVGVFSSLNSEQEEFAKQIVQKIVGRKFPVSVSHTIGGTGFIERENATILNVALQKSMQVGFMAFQEVLNTLEIKTQLYVTQNNGTIISLEDALNFPILTISAGPTNSFVGAAKLANLNNAIVVDVG